MSKPSPTPDCGSPGDPLAALKKQLDEAVDKARQLANDQADNKRLQEDLKKAIESFGKNVAGFQSGGDDLRDQFDEAVAKVNEGIACLTQHHGPVVTAVVAAVGALDDAIAETSKAAEDAESKLFGAVDLTHRKAVREEKYARQDYESLQFDALKARVSDAQAKLKEALAAEGKGELGRQFALLWLADRRLKYTWLQSDLAAEEVGFDFPKNDDEYLAQLKAAAEASLTAAKKANEAAFALKGVQDGYAADVKAFADLRKSRQADILKAAGEVDADPHEAVAEAPALQTKSPAKAGR